ncbi:hypothetical protein BDV93DRAFT_514577 [Ceratobasidium sp. AG-I]|nr:hypothetical protein BDV93DRAFT_514577 [Ceratobasidium sp. AG-I]
MRDISSVRTFTDLLTQEMSLLEPFARSAKCLESSASTPADVCLFWLATLAVLHDIFTDSDKRDELMLTENTISEVYLATLFLDFRYLTSTIFARRQTNPLSTIISLRTTRTLPDSDDTPTHDTPDSDLRASLPAYESIGDYLGATEVFKLYENSAAIIREYRFQFMNYVPQTAPFDRYITQQTALVYWRKLARHADAQIIAFLAIKLYSVVPNSMAEERTVSNFTKLNSTDRGRQKTSTLVYMTQVRQHHQRLLNPTKQAIAPTVRFRDLLDTVECEEKESLESEAPALPLEPAHSSAGPSGSTTTDEPANDTVDDVEEADVWEQEAGFDEVIE